MLTLTYCVIAIAVVVTGLSFLSTTNWWEKHICSDFSASGHHPLCFDCNETENDICYTDKCPIIILERQIHKA